MKLHNYIIIFYFLFLNLFVSAQFEKIIEHKIIKNDFSGGLALETSTGDYIILTDDIYSFVDGDSVNINRPVSLFKISQNGNIIDSIHLFNINLSGDLININNNEILITGSFTGAFQDTFFNKPVLSKIDENLNIISIDTLDLPNWFVFPPGFPTELNYPFTFGFYCKKILPTKAGNFLATTRANPWEYVFYEMNADLDTIQTKEFFSNYFSIPMFLNNKNDSSFYVFLDLEVYKVNKNLEFTYIKNLESDVYDNMTRLMTVKYLNDNRILMYFGANVFYPETNSFDKQVGVYIVDTLFNLHNYTHLGYSKDTLDMPVSKRNGIDFTDPNNIFVVGVINNSVYSGFPEEEVSSIMVSILDSNLNIKNQTFYGFDDRYLPNDIKATSDGGCLIVSSKYEINSGNDYAYIHLLKVNENGELSPPISNEEINNSTMKLAFIYPNPSKDFINVRYGAHLKNVSIEIFDISGKKIFVKNLKNPISRIDIQNLKIGSYVYHILNDNKIIEKEILIKK